MQSQYLDFALSSVVDPSSPADPVRNARLLSKTIAGRSTQTFINCPLYIATLLTLMNVVWTFYTLQNNSEIHYESTIYLNDSCELDYDPNFSLKYFLKIAFV